MFKEGKDGDVLVSAFSVSLTRKDLKVIGFSRNDPRVGTPSRA